MSARHTKAQIRHGALPDVGAQADEHIWARDKALAMELLFGHRAKTKTVWPTGAHERYGLGALTRILRAASLNGPSYRPLPRKMARGLMHLFNPEGLHPRSIKLQNRSEGRGGGADFMFDLEVDAFCGELEARRESAMARADDVKSKKDTAKIKAKAAKIYSLKVAEKEFNLSRNAIREARQRARHNMSPQMFPKPRHSGR